MTGAPTAERLEELLGGNAPGFAESARRRFERAAGAHSSRIVVFGAGPLGRVVLAGLERSGLRALAIADNDTARQGTCVEGVPIVSPAEAVSRWRGEAVFIVAVYNAAAPAAQLRREGAERITSYAHLFASRPNEFLPFMCLGDPEEVLSHAAEIRRAFDLMADEESRREFVTQIERRLFVGFDDHERPQTPEQRDSEYFPRDVYDPADDEVFVDCGAYDGDTIRRFLRRRNGRFGRIIAVEADPGSCERLRGYVRSLAPDAAGRIRVEQTALSDGSGMVAFDDSGSVVSAVRTGGHLEVRADTLDSILDGERPTVVKMDLEGGEPEALAGAAGTIREYAPVMAVCVYHRADHLWRLPLTLAEASPEYRLYLRAHAEDCWDVSVYAVPKRRRVMEQRTE
jgi:FkbM family methyltransferase